MSERLKARYYCHKRIFIADMTRIFTNCRLYNEPDTEYYKCANVVERFFLSKMKEAGLMDKWTKCLCSIQRMWRNEKKPVVDASSIVNFTYWNSMEVSVYVYCKLCTLSAMKNVHAALTLKGWQHWLLWMFELHLPIKKNQTDQITYLVPCCAQNITLTLPGLWL